MLSTCRETEKRGAHPGTAQFSIQLKNHFVRFVQFPALILKDIGYERSFSKAEQTI